MHVGGRQIAQVRQEAAEREIRHQKELATMYTEMNEKLNKNTEFFINIMRGAGISIPDNTPWNELWQQELEFMLR
ncbi:hypothetical protein LguiA_021690 [Lonicera macranthoides]